jgi:Uma2 family endonuclease
MSAVLQTEVRRHRLTVDDFHRMGEAGILRTDERVELIDGEIIDMAPIGSNHAGTIGFFGQETGTGRGRLGPSVCPESAFTYGE